MTLSIIAAVSTNNVIGHDGSIPWNMPRDHYRFRSIVKGHPVIMGARTYQSHIEKFPDAIVVSSTLPDYWKYVRVETVEDAIRAAGDDAFVLGGYNIFKAALPYVDCMYLTLVHAVVEGNARFPLYDAHEWVVKERRDWPADRANEYPYSFVKMVRGF